jgi:CubicO group peptidase (beta-lactamase class C family)
VPNEMRAGKLPGLSLAVTQDGKIIYAEGFGSRDREKNLPATPDTLYGIGSITKSFVAIAIMQLIEKGEIDLDDPVSMHTPMRLGLDENPITIHHLLTHSLGVPSLGTSSVAFYKAVGHDTGIPFGSPDDFYRLLNGARDEIVDEPGKRFFYHNAAWRVLGHIVQLKTGKAFHRYIKENIMSPLGMKRSTLNTAEFNSDPNRITCYWKKPDGEIAPTQFPYPNPEDNPSFSFLAAAGGVTSCANEMSLYMNALINKDPTLISPESYDRMQTLQIRRSDGYYGKYGYGYGLNITPDFHGCKMISHGGSILVSTAHMSMVPENEMGVIIMGNSSKIAYEAINESILALLMGLDPGESTPELVVKGRLRDLTGRYETYMGIETVDVNYKTGLLYLESETPFEKTRTPLIPEDPSLEETIFYTIVDGVKSPVVFEKKKDGVDLYIERYCYHRINTL